MPYPHDPNDRYSDLTFCRGWGLRGCSTSERVFYNLIMLKKYWSFFQVLSCFLLSTFLLNCFLCRDRRHGDVPLWLGAALLSCLRASTAWGSYPDLVEGSIYYYVNAHQYSSFLETRLIGSRAGIELRTFRSRGARSAIRATGFRSLYVISINK